MDKAILYIHGKGGNPKEAEYYKALFEEYDVIGFDYSSQSPWEAKKEFPRLFDNLCGTYETVTVIANSIGAFFAPLSFTAFYTFLLFQSFTTDSSILLDGGPVPIFISHFYKS